MKKIPFALPILPLLLMQTACSTDEVSTGDVARKTIILVMDYYAAGDFGYNDLILEGVYRAAAELDANLSLFRFNSDDMLRDFVYDWAETSSAAPTMLIFASADIASKVADVRNGGSDHLMLAVEAEGVRVPEGCRTFSISRYGASYLAGCMAGENPTPVIIAARPNDPVLSPATDGFTAGFSLVNPGVEVDTRYVTDSGDEEGFSMPAQAYAIAGGVPPQSFIFPLAGGSNAGIYKYVRDHEFTELMVCGMDTDCSGICPRSPFSLTIAVDRVIQEAILRVFEGGDPADQRYDLANGYTDIVVNPDFYDNLVVWEEYYDSPDYWSDRKDMYLDKAIAEETLWQRSMGEISVTQ